MTDVSLLTDSLSVLVKTFCSHALEYGKSSLDIEWLQNSTQLATEWYTNMLTYSYIELPNTLTIIGLA